MGGLETYKRIQVIHPNQKVVIASGYSKSDDVEELLSLGAGKYLKKPYLINDISSAVRSVLDQKKDLSG